MSNKRMYALVIFGTALVITLLTWGLTPWLVTPWLGAGWAIWQKLEGSAPHCPWPRIVSFYSQVERFGVLLDAERRSLKMIGHDREYGIQQIQSAHGTFWIKADGSSLDGAGLLAYLLAEHKWMQENNPIQTPGEGDYRH